VRERFLATYFRAARLVHLVTGAGALTAIALSPLFLSSWIGPEMAERGALYLRLFVLGYWVVSVGSVDGGCVEAWGHPRGTAGVASAAGIVAAAAGLGGWLLRLDPLVSLAVAVSVWLVATGLGYMVLWQRVSGMAVSRLFRGIGRPLLEMAVLAALVATLLGSIPMSRAAGLVSLVAVAGLLGAYGGLRMFTLAERRSLWGRLRVFATGGAAW